MSEDKGPGFLCVRGFAAVLHDGFWKAEEEGGGDGTGSCSTQSDLGRAVYPKTPRAGEFYSSLGFSTPEQEGRGGGGVYEGKSRPQEMTQLRDSQSRRVVGPQPGSLAHGGAPTLGFSEWGKGGTGSRCWAWPSKG